MEGIDLKYLEKNSPGFINKAFDRDPARSIKRSKIKDIESTYGADNGPVIKNPYCYNRKELSTFTLEDFAKLYFSSAHNLHGSIEKLFQKVSRYEIIKKIKNSMWRYGTHSAGWNETVDIYRKLPRFDLGLDGFTVKLDHTKYYNQKGWSRYSRTYLDGVFAYLIYYRGEHVMTVGFSFIGDKKIILQQVQCVSKKGNRWMYKIPGKRLQYIISRMFRCFTGYSIYIINIESWLSVEIEYFQRKLSIYQERNSTNENVSDNIMFFANKIEVLSGSRDRLVSFYNNSGYKHGKEISRGGLKFYKVLKTKKK